MATPKPKSKKNRKQVQSIDSQINDVVDAEVNIKMRAYVSVDRGNGNTECYYSNSEKILSASIPHGIAAWGDSRQASNVEGGNEYSVQYSYWKTWDNETNSYQEKIYAFGEDIWKLPKTQVITERDDPNRYHSNQAMFEICNSMMIAGVPGGTYKLLTYCPPGLLDSNQIEKIKKTVKSGPDGKGSAWQIKKKTGSKWIEYFFTDVKIVFEGETAYNAYRFDIAGNPVLLKENEEDKVDLGAGLASMVDLGLITADRIDLIDGKIVRENIDDASDNLLGIKTQIIDPIVSQLRKQTQSMYIDSFIVDQKLREWIISGKNPESAVLKIGRQNVKLHNTFEEMCNLYANTIYDRVIRPMISSGTNAIYVNGGGWLYILPQIQEMVKSSGSKVNLIYPQHKACMHLMSIPIHSLNAYGGLPYQAARIRRSVVKEKS